MNEPIIRFIQKQTCVTACCVSEKNKPYCFSCFYSFNAEEGLLFSKSSADSHHSALMKNNTFIAVTILPDKLNTLFVKGIHSEEVVLTADHPLTKKASGYCHKKYPIALAMQGEITVIQIIHIKTTVRTKGFGKK